jgi:hypothetical protein
MEDINILMEILFDNRENMTNGEYKTAVEALARIRKANKGESEDAPINVTIIPDEPQTVSGCWLKMMEYVADKLYCDIELIPMPSYAERLSVAFTPDSPDFAVAPPRDILHTHMFDLMLRRVYETYVEPDTALSTRIWRMLNRFKQSITFCSENGEKLIELRHGEFIRSVALHMDRIKDLGIEKYATMRMVEIDRQ